MRSDIIVNMNKNYKILIITSIGILLLVTTFFYINKGQNKNIKNNSTNTSENKTGTSTVTKKTTTTQTTGAIKIGQRILYNGIYITPLQVSFDGRCPIDAVCKQPSSLDLGVLLENNSITQNAIITSNKTASFAGKNITLTNVYPAKSIKKTIAPKDYSFTFKVTNQ